MVRSCSWRATRALVAASSVVLVCAGTAAAATFKSDSGKLAASKVSGVTASGGTLKFTGSANPTGKISFAGQIDFTSGQATGLSAGGSLTLKHSGKKATLKVTKISGTTLTAKLGSKSLSFPLNLSKAKSTPNSTDTGVSVTGVVVNLSSADAKALNKALKTKSFKSGKKFGTLSYDGIDRELIETTGGPLTLCNSASFDKKNQDNKVVATPVSPATPVTTGCTTASEDDLGVAFPENGKPMGFVDTATANGRLTLEGGIQDTQGTTTGKFTSLFFDLLGSKSVVSADVSGDGVSLGRNTVATVAFKSAPKLTITESGGTLTVPASGSTVALNSTGASLLNTTFCSSTCAGGMYSSGEAIGYSGGTTTFK